ncbi:MAG: heat-inducible transcriptional repressor HrcA [Oscillospiraceae bacterium]
MELTDRKKQILKIVVDGYVATAEPVSSKAIAEKMPGRISSATIRNELADLVEMGYLEQPHTSAGRVPSAKGYRLYVNELMERRALPEAEAESIRRSLTGQMSQVDQVMAQAGQMVSSMVGYPAYAVADHTQAVTVQRFDLIAVDDDSFIAVAMLSDSRVKSQLLRWQLPVEREALTEMSHLLNTHFTGLGPEEMNARLMSLSDQVSGKWFLLLNQVCEYAGQLLKDAAGQEVYLGGTTQLLKFPEYRDADKARDLMTFMVDNKQNLPVPSGNAPVQILIGPENVDAALKESSVVIASYDIGDGMRGLVGVVGPTRMDYASVAARLTCFAESLSHMFEKRQLPPTKERTVMSEKEKEEHPSGGAAAGRHRPGNGAGCGKGRRGGDLYRHP